MKLTEEEQDFIQLLRDWNIAPHRWAITLLPACSMETKEVLEKFYKKYKRKGGYDG